MTGIFLRIGRQGRWQAVALENLTAPEWAAFVATQSAADGWHWARRLAVWIRETLEQEPD